MTRDSGASRRLFVRGPPNEQSRPDVKKLCYPFRPHLG